MGAAYYIVFEKENDIDSSINGNGLSQDEELLNKIAENIGVTPLLHFFSIDEESVIDLLEEDDIQMDIPSECWFDAAEGLKTVQSLIAYLNENNNVVKENTINDLKNFERGLNEADSLNIKWHLAIDI